MKTIHFRKIQQFLKTNFRNILLFTVILALLFIIEAVVQAMINRDRT